MQGIMISVKIGMISFQSLTKTVRSTEKIWLDVPNQKGTEILEKTVLVICKIL